MVRDGILAFPPSNLPFSGISIRFLFLYQVTAFAVPLVITHTIVTLSYNVGEYMVTGALIDKEPEKIDVCFISIAIVSQETTSITVLLYRNLKYSTANL